MMISKLILNKITERGDSAISLPFISIHPIVKYFTSLLFVSLGLPYGIYHFDTTAALPDLGISYLFLLALIFFLLVLLLCWNLFNKSWARLGLPPMVYMVKHFKELSLWQQILLYWLSFALLFLAAISSLIAIY